MVIRAKQTYAIARKLPSCHSKKVCICCGWAIVVVVGQESKKKRARKSMSERERERATERKGENDKEFRAGGKMETLDSRTERGQN